MTLIYIELDPRHKHIKYPAHAEKQIHTLGFKGDSRVKNAMFENIVSSAFTPTIAVKVNQCMSDCSVGACRGSSAISWTLHQQMELYCWGWFEGLQMEEAVSVLPRGHFIQPLLQLPFSASLQTSPVVFLNHLTLPAATQMAPESPQTATFTHTRRGRCSQEVNIIILEIIDRRKRKQCQHWWSVRAVSVWIMLITPFDTWLLWHLHVHISNFKRDLLSITTSHKIHMGMLPWTKWGWVKQSWPCTDWPDDFLDSSSEVFTWHDQSMHTLFLNQTCLWSLLLIK